MSEKEIYIYYIKLLIIQAKANHEYMEKAVDEIYMALYYNDDDNSQNEIEYMILNNPEAILNELE